MVFTFTQLCEKHNYFFSVQKTAPSTTEVLFSSRLEVSHVDLLYGFGYLSIISCLLVSENTSILYTMVAKGVL